MNFNHIFADHILKALFPRARTDEFFEALYGDAAEGPYDILLKFKGENKDTLHFEFQLKQRPGRCLACNLTYGLPAVFSRHPIINVAELVEEIALLLDGQGRCESWQLGHTKVLSNEVHAIPLVLFLTADQ